MDGELPMVDDKRSCSELDNPRFYIIRGNSEGPGSPKRTTLENSRNAVSKPR